MPSDSAATNSMPIILIASPEYRCWECENPLLPRFCGVSASIRDHLLLFLVCSTTCQAGVLEDSKHIGVEFLPLSPPVVRCLLDDEENIVAIVEGQRIADGLLLAPYGTGPRGLARELLQMRNWETRKQ